MKNKTKKRDKWPKLVKVGNVAVKVYRRIRSNGSFGYEVADYTKGRRILRSFPTVKKAFDQADLIGKELSRGEAHGHTMSPKERASYGRAMELLKPTGLSLEVGIATLSEAIKILGGNRVIEAVKFYRVRNPDTLPKHTVQTVVDELVAMKEGRKKSVRYVSDLRNRLDSFASAFAVPISDVLTVDIQRWLDGLGVSAQTHKNFRTVLFTLFAFAERRGYILKGENPVSGTERIETNGGHVSIYTPEEITRLLDVASKDFLPVIAIGAFCGLRSAELERLHWHELDLKRGHLAIGADKAKTASRRIIPIPDNLKLWLEPYAKRSGPVWKGTHDEFYDAQQDTARATAVEADAEKGIEAVAALDWKPNALRHSFISYRLAVTQSAAQVALEAGNSPSVVFRHYRELVNPEDALRWFAVAPNRAANVIAVGAASQGGKL
jgi:integrase